MYNKSKVKLEEGEKMVVTGGMVSAGVCVRACVIVSHACLCVCLCVIVYHVCLEGNLHKDLQSAYYVRDKNHGKR